MKNLLAGIKQHIEVRGGEVYLALERRKWGKEFWSDEDCVRTDCEKIKDSDIIVALFDGTFSGGVHVELGWASAMNKKIVILTNDKIHLCSLTRGIEVVSECEIIEFCDISNPYDQLKKRIEKCKN